MTSNKLGLGATFKPEAGGASIVEEGIRDYLLEKIESLDEGATLKDLADSLRADIVEEALKRQAPTVPFEMKDIEVHEVSLVDRPPHGHSLITTKFRHDP